jgi:DNA-binding SARP family transcriptional activator
MLTIRTLGSLSLLDSAGQEVTSVLAQPKRFSILVYLAVNRPVGLHRRNSLLTLFWPGLPESRARNALSQGLSFLRRNTTPDTIVSRGVDEIGVSPGRIQVDTLAFQGALEAGAWSEALAMYRGEFLRGLYVPGAPDFEEWMRNERNRLQALAADAAWALARDQVGRGALAEGERTASRALSLACPNETTVRRFIEVLLRSGDRVAALRFFHEFLTTLEKALELEPTEELRALGEMLRSEGICGRSLERLYRSSPE